MVVVSLVAPNQKIGEIMSFSENITNRKNAELELRQAKEDLEIRISELTTELEQIKIKLQQSESILWSFFNHENMMAIVELDHNNIRYISVNKAMAGFLGTTSEALLNRLDSEMDESPERPQQWLEYYQISQSRQAPVSFEYCDDTDKKRWLFVNICPIALGSYRLPQFSFIAKDITDRKLVEETLAQQEELVRLTLEFTKIGTWNWDVRTGEVVWNDNHFRLLGLEPKSTPDLYQIWLKAIHPDDRSQVEQSLLNALKHHTDYEREYRVIYPDGTLHWLIGKGCAIYDAEGEPIRMLGVILDITDRKQAQQKLELQAVITRNMAEGICLVRIDNGIIVYANPKFEQMFGYDPDELNGRHVSIVNYGNDERDAEAVNQAIRSTVLQHGEATYEVYNVKKNGTAFWCSATTSVFQHPDYGYVLVAVQQDITDRKQAEERVTASLKEKEVLLKEIHHRVKNNLGIVSGLLQIQSRRTQDPQANMILRDSENRIASIALVHEKLYRSQDLANIDFAQYLQDLTVYLFDSYNINSSQVTLDIQVETVNLEIETAIPCGLIVNELVSNALKHAFPNDRSGEIQIRLISLVDSVMVGSQNSSFTLIVRDNGIGLPDDFDLEKTTTLGISLVQGLVTQIRGVFEITRQLGTEVKITFRGGNY